MTRPGGDPPGHSPVGVAGADPVAPDAGRDGRREARAAPSDDRRSPAPLYFLLVVPAFMLLGAARTIIASARRLIRRGS